MAALSKYTKLHLVSVAPGETLRDSLLQVGSGEEGLTLTTPRREVVRSRSILQEMAGVSIWLTDTAMSSELRVYRKARPWGAPQPVPTIIVANEVAGELIEKDVGLHRVHKTPGSFAVHRAAGEPAILLGRDSTQPRGVQEVSAEADALARIVIDGSGAIGITCLSQRGLWVRGVVPATLMAEDNPPVAVS